MSKVLFKIGTQSEYDSLTQEGEILQNALYFITDTQRLYKGSILFSVGKEATQSAIGLLSPSDKEKIDQLMALTEQEIRDICQ